MKIDSRLMPDLPVFAENLQVVFHIRDDDGSVPMLYTDDGVPRPDRHLMLGIAQATLMAIEETDPETVVFLESCAIELNRSGETILLNGGLTVVRSESGKLGALAPATPREARRLARKGVRWFTGAIRLDIP
jgi:hypothetical protein